MTEQQLKAGVCDNSIPSAVANTGATSSVGTIKNKHRNAFIPTGQQSTKAFHMPNGTVEAATDMDELHHDVHHPAKDIHIVPGIERDLLLSMVKFADTNYIVIFNKDKLNIYDANNTKVTVSCSAILCGWQCMEKIFGAFLSYPTSPTTSRILSYATDHQQSSYRNALHRWTPSTTSMSSKHNPSLSAPTAWLPDSQQNLHGSRQSRTKNLHLGPVSWPMQSSSTSRNQRKCQGTRKKNAQWPTINQDHAYKQQR
jgi:hypothetical protein